MPYINQFLKGEPQWLQRKKLQRKQQKKSNQYLMY